MPVVTYMDTDRDKSITIKENKNKSDIYRGVNKINGKNYGGSSVNLRGKFSIYYIKKPCLVN
jgi:hypothetical protein